MPVGIRGFNPIWLLADLVGNLFDDTFYMFVLENTIPYIPVPVYHDAELNVAWTNPIQFLANGTLPVNVFFEEGRVYRLEFRQGPTQAYPLIYEVNDYIPGEEIIPDDTSTFPSSNQITNPQFALINFTDSLVISATDPDPTLVAPGWYFEAAGTGTATITQVPLNDSTKNPSNAPYALRLVLTGWNAGEVFLRQRFEQNGMLWANKYVSGAITTRVGGAFQSLESNLIDSEGNPLATILEIPTITASFNEFTGSKQLPDTDNTDIPPNASIDYKITLPNNSDIYVTSIQLVVQDNLARPAFEQDSINRQIDHTYNTAYPIVPIGTVIDFGGFVIPAHYLLCSGTAVSRTTYNLLFEAITQTETVTLTMGVNTFVAANHTDYYIGMFLESTNIPAATTITNIGGGGTITMSANATASGASVVRFFAYGRGNGTTTFNLPLLSDYVIAGYGGLLFGNGLNGVGTKGGASTHAITINEMPAHNHPGSTIAVGGGGGGTLPTAANLTPSTTNAVTVASQGGGVAMSLVQQTILMKKCIRYE